MASSILLTAFDFPLRFVSNGDISRTGGEASIENNLRLSIMIRSRGIPLAAHLGSQVPMLPFDPNDLVTESLITEEIIRSTRIGEPRAVVDTGIITSEDENTARAIVPYAIPGRKDWSTLKLRLPSQSLD